MRVVYFSPCWPPDRIPNGIATYVQGVRRGLAALDCESQVLTHDPGPGEPGKDVIPLLPDRGPLAARLRVRAAAMWSRHFGFQQDVGGRIGRQLAALDAERSIDVFEMEETFGSAARVPDYFSKPVVVRLHGPHCILGPTLGEPEDREYHLRCRAERKAITRASVVTSPGRSALAVVRGEDDDSDEDERPVRGTSEKDCPACQGAHTRHICLKGALARKARDKERKEARAKKSREAQERAKIRAKERAMAAVEKLKSEGDDFVGGVKGPPLVEKVDIRPTVQAFQSFHRPRPQPPKPTGEDVADR